MKRIVALVCGLAMMAVGHEAVAQGDKPTEAEATLIEAGMTAPAFVAQMLDGSSVDSSTLAGKVVLLNFWATWCPPCRQELARVQADIVDRYAGTDLVFIALSRGEERAVVAKFMKKQGYTFPVGVDAKNEVYDKFATAYIPRNFLIDRDGRVVLASVGYTPKEFDAMLKKIDALLGK